MSKVLWHITMSLDGFIAGPGDDMGWLGDYFGPNPTADEVLSQIGALLIGARTYQGAKTDEGKVYGGAWTGPQKEHDAAHRSSMYAFMEVPIELVPAVHLRRFGRLSVDFGESRSTYI